MSPFVSIWYIMVCCTLIFTPKIPPIIICISSRSKTWYPPNFWVCIFREITNHPCVSFFLYAFMLTLIQNTKNMFCFFCLCCKLGFESRRSNVVSRVRFCSLKYLHVFYFFSLLHTLCKVDQNLIILIFRFYRQTVKSNSTLCRKLAGKIFRALIFY